MTSIQDVLDGTILKLTLQPLVENALYHGIKSKRNGGQITVRARRAEPDLILLEVEDDGVGFTPYKLAQIQASLNDDIQRDHADRERFRAWKTSTSASSCITEGNTASRCSSQYQSGTCVTLVIPLQIDPDRQE